MTSCPMPEITKDKWKLPTYTWNLLSYRSPFMTDCFQASINHIINWWATLIRQSFSQLSMLSFHTPKQTPTHTHTYTQTPITRTSQESLISWWGFDDKPSHNQAIIALWCGPEVYSGTHHPTPRGLRSRSARGHRGESAHSASHDCNAAHWTQPRLCTFPPLKRQRWGPIITNSWNAKRQSHKSPVPRISS